MSWALDIILLVLVVVCTVYCWLLNRRIKSLQDSKEEFVTMLQDLDKAVQNAESSVNELQSLSNVTSSELLSGIKNADELKGELLMLNKVGNDLADRLEQAMSDARAIPQQPTVAKTAAKKASAPKKTASKKKAPAKEVSQVLVPEHKDEYDPQILEITTEDGDKANMDQNSYFESLKKVSITK